MDTELNNIVINNTVVSPGSQSIIMLPMPKLYDWTPLYMPIHVINGKKKGPVLCITAAIHGDEVNGIEIIRRLLKKSIIRKLSGALIAIPIVNVYGFLYCNRYLMDRRDLNRSFPGSTQGSLASRLANLIIKEIVFQTTHIIDLHAGSHHRCNLPQIRANIDLPGIRELAIAFKVPVVLDAKERDGSLRQAANDRNIPFLLYEAGESLRFDEISIRTGLNGILGVMQALQMINPKSTKVKRITPKFAKSSFWVRAPCSGILHPIKVLGKRVKKGDVLAIIANPSSIKEEFKLRAPEEGIIIGKNNLPLVHEGAALFHIACFKDIHLVEKQIEYLRTAVGEDIDINLD